MVGPPPPDWSVDPAAVAVHEVAPRMWQLRLPLTWPGISHVNAYLAERPGDGVILFDCGSAGHPSTWDALVAGIRATGHEVEEIRGLVATHAHSDHVGVAKAVVDASGCEFWVHPKHQALTDGGRFPDRIAAARGRRALKEGVAPADVGFYSDVGEEVDGVDLPFPDSRDLVEGVHLDTALGAWKVVETPGHAPSHVCLLQPERRLLLSGDLLSRIFYPYFDYGYSEDPVGEFARSLTAVAELDVATVLPGHGRPLDDLRLLVEEHRWGLDARLAAVRAAVEAGPASGQELAERVFGPAASPLDAVAHLGETVAYLRHLRLAGAVRRDEDADGIFRYSAL